MKGIDPDAPVLTGTYSFDVQRALDLVRYAPQQSPQ
jgi:hypothetical protein